MSFINSYVQVCENVLKCQISDGYRKEKSKS
jgi:hypothetical protein